MANVELIMPKMGESIAEATILKWVKNEGDPVELDETILEIATDKVDSEIPSPVAGTITKVLFPEDSVVEVGTVIAMIDTVGDDAAVASPALEKTSAAKQEEQNGLGKKSTPQSQPKPAVASVESQVSPSGETEVPRKSAASGKFYSPLVRNIASTEGITVTELDAIQGSGAGGRVTKKDILRYVDQRKSGPASMPKHITAPPHASQREAAAPTAPAMAVADTTTDNVEIIEMDRMRRLIADHMVTSMQTSPHVTSFVEVDVTNIVNWRNSIKDAFLEQHGQKITFTPIFIEAVVKAIRDFPMINVSVDGHTIVRKKDINIGMATALPGGNLIVPVIRNADGFNLVGLTKAVNGLADRARAGALKPEEIQGGTFTLTNVGTFGNVMGTPIINQPQVAILATGAIRKKPAVVETAYGDLIAIRQMMFLSLSYDHRVVDGFLGGSFLRRIGDYLEAFDTSQQI